MTEARRRFSLAACPRCGEPVRRLERINEDETRDWRWVHDDGTPDCDTRPSGERFRVSAIEDDSAALRLVISCSDCGGEETMNDEEGRCRLDELVRWAQEHACNPATLPCGWPGKRGAVLLGHLDEFCPYCLAGDCGSCEGDPCRCGHGGKFRSMPPPP